MGLIRAGLGAVSGVLADQWKEFFYCEAIDKNVMMVKGQKRVGGRSSNTRGSDNIISNGSGIAVADGQCMIIVDQGKIVEMCAEPGEFTYDSSSEPSIFTGDLKESVKQSFDEIARRFTYGGDTGKDQRVYYFNTKELIDNKFGTPNPVPFRVSEPRLNLYLETAVRCSGVYSYRIVDPLLFYTKVCGNVSVQYDRTQIDPQLKAEFISALNVGFGQLAALEMLPSQITTHNAELEEAMNAALAKKWGERGLEIVSVALSSVTIPPEDADIIKQAQRNAILKDPTMAAATIAGAQAEAMKAAASNTSGAMNGFIGMNMATGAGGFNAQDLFKMGQTQPQQAAPAKGWKCPKCGAVATGKFCPECGTAKPEDGWKCACGAVNKGKFCAECGAKKPAGALLYKCDKCGWEPEDPAHPPKFCPECGDLFDESDIVK